MDENVNGAAEIDDGVGFDCRLGRAEVGPREQCQTQIDGGGVQRIERFLETQTDVLALMQFDRYGNQSMTECFEHSPVASLVGIGQGGTGYLAANSDVVELGALRIQTSHQIAQALASGEVGIGNAQKMVPGREGLYTVVPRKPFAQRPAVRECRKH